MKLIHTLGSVALPMLLLLLLLFQLGSFVESKGGTKEEKGKKNTDTGDREHPASGTSEQQTGISNLAVTAASEAVGTAGGITAPNPSDGSSASSHQQQQRHQYQQQQRHHQQRIVQPEITGIAKDIQGSSQSLGDEQDQPIRSHVVIRPTPRYAAYPSAASSSQQSSVNALKTQQQQQQQQPQQKTSKVIVAASAYGVKRTGANKHSGGVEHPGHQQQQLEHQIHQPLPFKKRAFSSMFQRSLSDVGPRGHPSHNELRVDLPKAFRDIPIYREGEGWQKQLSSPEQATGQDEEKVLGILNPTAAETIRSQKSPLSSAYSPSSSSISSASFSYKIPPIMKSKYMGRSRTFPSRFNQHASSSSLNSGFVEDSGENLSPSTPSEQQQHQQEAHHHQQHNETAVDLSSPARQFLQPDTALLFKPQEQESTSGGINCSQPDEEKDVDDVGDD